MGVDPEDVAPDMIEWAKENGFKNFDRMRDQVSRLEKNPSQVRMRLSRDGKTARLVGDQRGRSRNLDAMDEFAERYNLPDTAWLYYH